MKAWIVKDKDEPESTVVFAETRGKAKSLALQTDCCEYLDFLDIEVLRFKEADHLYKGVTEIDWDCDEDRMFLVQYGWHCEYVEIDECYECCAKDECVACFKRLAEYECEL